MQSRFLSTHRVHGYVDSELHLTLSCRQAVQTPTVRFFLPASMSDTVEAYYEHCEKNIEGKSRHSNILGLPEALSPGTGTKHQPLPLASRRMNTSMKVMPRRSCGQAKDSAEPAEPRRNGLLSQRSVLGSHDCTPRNGMAARPNAGGMGMGLIRGYSLLPSQCVLTGLGSVAQNSARAISDEGWH